ncbi:MAG TPA: rod shape-determining protein RodA [Verrucomicrobiae bacterium]|nr:rod shape-determining protein RodA [Verrucomicrobiae bacterium]
MTGFHNKEPHARIDWLMVAALVCLMFIGIMFVYSATMANDASAHVVWHKQSWVRQLIWCVFGLGAAGAVCLIDYRIMSRWALVIYAFTIFMLIIVLIPGIGSTQGWGARRWIVLGPANIQPSEFAKLGFILAMANFLSRPPDELRSVGIFWKALLMLVVPFLLIMKEPDLGSALILLPVGLTMLFVAGVPPRYINTLIAVSGLVVGLILVDVLFAPPSWQIKLENYQKRRLLVYFGLDGAPRNATPSQKAEARRAQRDYSYNVEQALISVGSGGLLGKGWCEGKQTALGYLPKAVAHNDFIFSVIAEEKGFIGSVTVVLLYSVVLFTGIRIAGQARDRLGKLLAVGVVAMYFSHVFINIGMNIRLMPVTGVPLPLLSYGGSSVLCSLIAAGILQNVNIHRRS